MLPPPIGFLLLSFSISFCLQWQAKWPNHPHSRHLWLPLFPLIISMYAWVQGVVTVVKFIVKRFGRDDRQYNRTSLLRLLGRTVLTQLASYQLLVAKSHLYFTKGKTGSIPKKGIPKLDGAFKSKPSFPCMDRPRGLQHRATSEMTM